MTPSIFVTTKKCFAQDPANGLWFDLLDYSDEEDFLENVKVLYRELDEDDTYFFSDWTDIPEEVLKKEGHVNWEYIDVLSELSGDSQDAYYEYCKNLFYIFDKDTFEDAYITTLAPSESECDFIMQYASDFLDDEDIPQVCRLYFNWDSYTQDRFIDTYTCYDQHVFYQI
ncbi:antirestriction protein ArdA [Xenorhabdus sp. XENO-10]|uniref:Antirestriction protein ArdA n=1 Tax=Xenorhabdus yunnanensis TaxID=3025878 RepID=A0ABT5LH25_9GAMM|nr:antirestriction protein ArdA [Xenorhabdus yunnanensis]MDC9589786.1 antirestriction protein ArdA [Xenorhabdus yunnanensis]